MSCTLTNLQVIHKLRRLNTLLILGKRSNVLALATRKAIEMISTWPQDALFVDAFNQAQPYIVFAGFGPKFIKIVGELLKTGEIPMVNQLQEEHSEFFCELCEIPGIGESGARRIYFEKLIENFDDLRVASANGVLSTIPAFGEARLRAIDDWIKAKSHDESVMACDMKKSDRSAKEAKEIECIHLGEAPDISEIGEACIERGDHDISSNSDKPEDDEFMDFVECAELDDDLKRALAAIPPKETRVPNCDAPSVAQNLNNSAQQVLNYALSRVLPPAFIARYIDISELWKPSDDVKILIFGQVCEPLTYCITRQCEPRSVTVVDALCDIPPENSFDRIVVDPFARVNTEVFDMLQSKLNAGGILVSCRIETSRNLPTQLLLLAQSIGLASLDISMQPGIAIEDVEFLTIYKCTRQ